MKFLRKITGALLLLVYGIVTIFPVFWLLVSSITGKRELLFYLDGILGGEGKTAFYFFPSFPTLRGYTELLFDTPEFYVVFWNSVILTVCIVGLQMLTAVPAAFGFARWDSLLGSILFYLYILLMLLPFQVIMLPEYLVIDRLGLMDTRLAVILPAAFSTFPVFLLYRFFEALPEELSDAFSLDSGSSIRFFLMVCVPAAKPGIAAAMLLGVVEYWNMIEQPLVFLKKPSLQPFSLVMPGLSRENLPYAFAFAFFVTIPMVLLMLGGKENLEKGIGTMVGKE